MAHRNQIFGSATKKHKSKLQIDNMALTPIIIIS